MHYLVVIANEVSVTNVGGKTQNSRILLRFRYVGPFAKVVRKVEF